MTPFGSGAVGTRGRRTPLGTLLLVYAALAALAALVIALVVQMNVQDGAVKTVVWGAAAILSVAVIVSLCRVRVPLVVALLLLFVAASVVAAFAVQADVDDTAIRAAVWGLAVVVTFWVAAAVVFIPINTPRPAAPRPRPRPRPRRAAPAPQPATPASEEPPEAQLRKGAEIVMTVDGVVLGLVYGLAGGGAIADVVKVGAVSLAVGVVLALTLFSLATDSFRTMAAWVTGNLLYSLAAWAMAFGLLCVVAALVFP
jgi:hypothetical protein